jgi:hypothetical protein
MYSCECCGFKAKSKHGLRQHIDAKPECLALERRKAQQLMKISSSALGIQQIRSRQVAINKREVADFCADLRKKPPPFASIPTPNQREIAEEENWTMFGHDSEEELQVISSSKKRQRDMDDEDQVNISGVDISDLSKQKKKHFGPARY